MNRPTPETDEWNAAWLKADDFDGETPAFPMDFARRLERERDEALELARELRDALEKQHKFSSGFSDTSPKSAFIKMQRDTARLIAKAKEVLL